MLISCLSLIAFLGGNLKRKDLSFGFTLQILDFKIIDCSRDILSVQGSTL